LPTSSHKAKEREREGEREKRGGGGFKVVKMGFGSG